MHLLWRCISILALTGGAKGAVQCDPSLVCGQAETCVDGLLYPTSCGGDNCDEPLGTCCFADTGDDCCMPHAEHIDACESACCIGVCMGCDDPATSMMPGMEHCLDDYCGNCHGSCSAAHYVFLPPSSTGFFLTSSNIQISSNI